MKKYLFKVISWCNNELSYYDKMNDFVLENDNWNDYGFRTTYHLHIGSNILGSNKTEYLGYVKILKKGQTDIESNLVPKSFNRLGSDFCSFSASLDLYEKAHKYLDKAQRIELMVALRSIVYDSKIIDSFKDEEGFNTSLLRDTDLNDDVFKLAPIYIQENSKLLTDINEIITIKLKNFQNELNLNFGSNNSFQDMPDRVNVLIGRNGCGKSTVLYKICKLLYASSDQRAKYKDKIGTISPSGIGFSKIICISYSPFDSFQMPGFSYADKKALCEGIENRDGRFIYCGIRDIAQEVRLNLDLYKKENEYNITNYFEDRIDTALLKNIFILGEEFTSLYFKIKNNQDKMRLLEECLNLLRLESSLSEFLSELTPLKLLVKLKLLHFSTS